MKRDQQKTRKERTFEGSGGVLVVGKLYLRSGDVDLGTHLWRLASNEKHSPRLLRLTKTVTP